MKHFLKVFVLPVLALLLVAATPVVINVVNTPGVTIGNGSISVTNYILTPVSYVTNLYVTTNYTQIQFVTNHYAISSYVLEEYVTNLYVTTNFVSESYVTNLYSTNIYTGRVTVNNITYTSSNPTTNAWSGPTNDLNMSVADQYYDTYVPISITGLTSKSNNVSQSVILTIRNLAATNIWCLLATGFRDAGSTNWITVSTNSDFVLSTRYSPATGGHTNSVSRTFSYY